jgi:hypothetical protein
MERNVEQCLALGIISVQIEWLIFIMGAVSCSTQRSLSLSNSFTRSIGKSPPAEDQTLVFGYRSVFYTRALAIDAHAINC